LQRICNWYSNQHRIKKSNPQVAEAVLDLSGKYSQKRPALQEWQAFSAMYYRPKNSPLRNEVRSLFEQRGDPGAVAFLADFLPPNADINDIDYLTFLSALFRERCTRLSDDEKQAVGAYIHEQESIAGQHRDHPWFLDDDFEDKPLAAENKYIQESVLFHIHRLSLNFLTMQFQTD
jgi:hypothetical protein